MLGTRPWGALAGGGAKEKYKGIFGGRYRHPAPRVYLVGIFGGRTELAEVSGIGFEVLPRLTGVFGRVLQPCRTIRFVRYILVRTLSLIHI